jgi:hypothetical protein
MNRFIKNQKILLMNFMGLSTVSKKLTIIPSQGGQNGRAETKKKDA